MALAERDFKARPDVAVIGSLVVGHLRRVARTVDLVQAAELRDRLGVFEEMSTRGRVVLCYWIEDVLSMVVAACQPSSPVADLSADLRLVCDDTIGGLVTADILGRVGMHPFLLPKLRFGPRLAALQEFIRTTHAKGIAVDGHGPYGEVGVALARLLQKSGAVAIPLGVAVDCAWSIRLRARLTIPRARARVALKVGDPIEFSTSVENLRDALQNGLDHARGLARTALEQGIVRTP